MTVCVATLFRWNYADASLPADYRMAGIICSDRMLTAGDVQYEPQKLKIGQITPNVTVAIAGDYPLHSQSIIDSRRLVLNSRDKSPENVARLYGRSIQNIKQRQAEELYLTPLGMNSDSFIAQQKDMSDSFVDRITHQIQRYEGEDVEALVIGSDGNDVHLYVVDTRGITHCMNDVGFAAIGSGAWHAKSRLMQAGYVNTSILSPALAATFAAKRSADVAPGVGKFTDTWLVLKDATFPLWTDTDKKLHELYEKYEKDRDALINNNVEELRQFIAHDPSKTDGNSPTNEGAGQPAPKKT